MLDEHAQEESAALAKSNGESVYSQSCVCCNSKYDACPSHRASVDVTAQVGQTLEKP